MVAACRKAGIDSLQDFTGRHQRSLVGLERMELRSLLCTNVSVFSSRSFSASSLIHPTSYGNHLKVSMEQKTPDQDTISNGYRQRSVFEVVEKECLMMPPIRCCETLGV